MDKKLMRLIEPGMGLFFAVLVLFAIIGFFVNIYIGIAELLLVVALYVYLRFATKQRRKEIKKYLDTMSQTASNVAAAAASSYPLPMALVRVDSDEIVWSNDAFSELWGDGDNLFQNRIVDVIERFDIRWLINGKTECPDTVVIGDRSYRIYGQLLRQNKKNSMLYVLIFVDITHYAHLETEIGMIRPVIGIVSVDNYDELSKAISEKPFLMASIDAKVTEWAKKTGGILVKKDRDRYVVVFEQRMLETVAADKFSVLDEVRKIVAGHIPATLSIGIGREGNTYDESWQYARLALDMALSRGGDQVVIKNRTSYEFFGGRSREVEKRTKVKSRVMANAMSDLIKTSSRVIVMGHKFSDMDSIGASAGVVCACRKMGVPANIVMDLGMTSAKVLHTLLTSASEYADVFVSPAEAETLCDGKTLLVVVDTTNPGFVEAPKLLETAKKIAVIDHHRRAASYIENADLSMHEPYASSACELVSEILQYIVAPADILRVEAESLLAGIMLDTKFFSMKAGVRTFEAAAFIRKAGADTIEVKKLFREDMDNYFERCRIITSAERYRDTIAIAYSYDNVPRPIAAQAADELLSVIGIDAGFVVFRSGDTTHISGRSLGEINIQMVVEQLGGGGSLNSGAAQLGDIPMEKATDMLKMAIDTYFSKL